MAVSFSHGDVSDGHIDAIHPAPFRVGTRRSRAVRLGSLAPVTAIIGGFKNVSCGATRIHGISYGLRSSPCKAAIAAAAAISARLPTASTPTPTFPTITPTLPSATGLAGFNPLMPAASPFGLPSATGLSGLLPGIPGMSPFPGLAGASAAAAGMSSLLGGIASQSPALPVLPGQPNLALISHLQALSAASATVNKTHKELYVGSLPQGITEAALITFLNSALSAAGLTLPNATGPGPVTKAWISQDQHFAFIELRSAEEATNAMMLDGLPIGGQTLRIRRPKNYVPPPGTAATPTALPSLTGGLTGLLGQPGASAASATGANAIGLGAGIASPGVGAAGAGLDAAGPKGASSRVIVLENMVTAEELMEDDEYEEIKEDVRDECSKHGQVVNITIPRPKRPLVDEEEGETEGELVIKQREQVGKIFVEYAELSQAAVAATALHGRHFGGRVVQVSYLEEAKYKIGVLI
eukprot:jgi/Mesvir1/29446/Mv23025-RA.1